MSNRLIMFFISIVCFIIIVSLVRSINSLWQKGNIITEQENLRDKALSEKQELQQKLNYIESPEFIEKQAREKLNLQREGEIVVVLPKDNDEGSQSAQPQPELANWQKWWKLFF